ncbi:hypothetical protein MMC29_007687, partial [Sticta canariensis]|nr:hypothetical protein [Sticta canariensis]
MFNHISTYAVIKIGVSIGPHFAGLVNIFTKNATLNAGTPENVYGIEVIQATLAALLLPTNITQFAITTQSYELLPPFDEQGAAGTAIGVVYTTAALIGQGNFSGQAVIGFARFEDKYVKTSDFALYGGWRISERIFILF